jgi:hypothetical protein
MSVEGSSNRSSKVGVDRWRYGGEPGGSAGDGCVVVSVGKAGVCR